MLRVGLESLHSTYSDCLCQLCRLMMTGTDPGHNQTTFIICSTVGVCAGVMCRGCWKEEISKHQTANGVTHNTSPLLWHFQAIELWLWPPPGGLCTTPCVHCWSVRRHCSGGGEVQCWQEKTWLQSFAPKWYLDKSAAAAAESREC